MLCYTALTSKPSVSDSSWTRRVLYSKCDFRHYVFEALERKLVGRENIAPIVQRNKGGWMDSEADKSRLQTFNERCQRREQRKAMKVARAQGLLRRVPKVSGAWID
jgi:hypothetical protein